MATIKTFSLCLGLLSFCNLSTMHHEYLALSNDIDVNGLKDIVLSKFWHKKKVQNPVLSEVWDRVDREYVEIDDCVMNVGWALRSLMGSCLSYYKGRYIAPQDAIDQMHQIESWIKSDAILENNQCNVFKKLVAGHWYVNYLMRAIVNENILYLEGVMGSTIDELYGKYYKAYSNSAEDIALLDAYAQSIGKEKKLTEIMPKVVSHIHFNVLYHPHGNVKPDSLRISHDGKYLQATAEDNVPVTWNMQTGKIVEKSSQIMRINEEWTTAKGYADNSRAKRAALVGYAYDFAEWYRVTDENDTYYAMVTHPDMSIDSDFFPMEVANNPKAIILFQRPHEESYLCQKAFDNSYMSSKQLEDLRNSKAFQSLNGFVKDNLERVIDNRIKALTNK